MQKAVTLAAESSFVSHISNTQTAWSGNLFNSSQAVQDLTLLARIKSQVEAEFLWYTLYQKALIAFLSMGQKPCFLSKHGSQGVHVRDESGIKTETLIF